MRRTTRFRRLLEAPEILMLPGVHDGLSARLAAAAGFEAVTMGGFAATGSLLGAPDSSQLGPTELADQYARICDAIDLPVFADADTGFGNPTNVRRAVRLYERAGVAGLFIEDQVFPKRCGHTAGKGIVPVEEFLAKLHAALEARTDPDLVIMARTDALAVEGLSAAIDRACLFREAGADLLFVEAPGSVEDMRRITSEVGGLHLANMIEGGASPELTTTELQQIGFAAATWPVSGMLTMTRALGEMYRGLRAAGTTREMHASMASFEEYLEVVGHSGMRAAEQAALDAARAQLHAPAAAARPKVSAGE